MTMFSFRRRASRSRSSRASSMSTEETPRKKAGLATKLGLTSPRSYDTKESKPTRTPASAPCKPVAAPAAAPPCPPATQPTVRRSSSGVGVRYSASESAVLGAGAYGSVIQGVDRVTGETVAIKCIADGRMRPEALMREVAILQRLSAGGHPNMLTFHAWLRPDSTEIKRNARNASCHCLVMEPAKGGELFEYVLAQGGLAEAEAAPLFAQVVAAVQYAHHVGIAHRDLKLENVLFSTDPLKSSTASSSSSNDDGEALLKLIDWGLAHQHALRADGTVVPEVLRSRCGSRSYMAPEVLRCGSSSSSSADKDKAAPAATGETRDRRAERPGYDGFGADVWSLGICLFAMVVGFFPFECADPGRDWRARKVLEAQARGESSVATIFSFYPKKQLRISRDLAALIDAMLAFDASQRCSLTQVLDATWLAPTLLKARDRRRAAAQAAADAAAAATTTSTPTRASATGGAAAVDERASPVSVGSSEASTPGSTKLVRTRAEHARDGQPTGLERQDSTHSTATSASSVSSAMHSLAQLRVLAPNGAAAGYVRVGEYVTSASAGVRQGRQPSASAARPMPRRSGGPAPLPDGWPGPA